MQRTARYYGKNEAVTMRDLGLLPVPRSGAGWVHKEDGESEAALCQLKSTDAAEARIRRIDLERLAYHAAISHKMPLFAIQFLSDGKIYFVVEKDKFAETAKALEGKSIQPAADKGSEAEAAAGDDCAAAVCVYNAARERFKIEQKEEFFRRSAELKACRRQEAKKWREQRQKL